MRPSVPGVCAQAAHLDRPTYPPCSRRAQVAQLFERGLVPWHAVLTKADALSVGALEAAARNVASQLSKLQLPFPVLSAVSARTGAGLTELTEMIVFSSKLHRAERGRALERSTEQP